MRRFSFLLAGCLGAALLVGTGICSADSLDWRAKQNQVDADVQTWDLITLLKKIARQTGWHIYVESGAQANISVKFKNLPQEEALRRLLGSLNYTNGASTLKVFRTTAKAATHFVAPEKKNYRIGNEALVQLKKGTTNNIDDLARKLGGKVIGTNDSLRFYRLQFGDDASAIAALQSLATDPSVQAADGNYTVDRPTPAQMTQIPNSSAPGFNLNPQPVANGPIVGLVDTSVDPPSQFAPYMLTPINVTGQQDTPGSEPSHGTGMLETLLAAMPNDPSKILPVDVYGNSPSTTTYEVMEGIVAAINAGANPINLSLGGTGNSDMMAALIQQGIKQGIVFVAAAGNTPGEGDVYPAMYPGVISVTASTQTVNGPITATSGGSQQLASYANDPSGTQVMAPGTSIIQWNGMTWEVQGTSPATASTTGTIAYLVNANHVSISQAAGMTTRASPAPGK